MCAERGLRIAVDDIYGNSEIYHANINIMNESLEVILINSNVIATEIAAGNIVVIHCQAGLQRSPTVAVAYIMQKYNISIKEAAKFVQDKTSNSYIFSDGIHFEASLNHFHNSLKKK